MKNILVGLLTFAIIGSWASVSFAETYVSGNLGVVIVEDSDIDDGPLSGEFTFDTGFGVLGAVGTSWENSGDRGSSGNGGRLEAELGYRQNDFDEVKVDGFGSANIDGDISALSLMANLYYDVSMEGSITPYIGVGAGVARIEADIDGASSEDDTVFAGQLILGGSIATSETLSVDLQYRYFATDDPEFDGLDAEYSTHNLMIGLRHSF